MCVLCDVCIAFVCEMEGAGPKNESRFGAFFLTLFSAIVCFNCECACFIDVAAQWLPCVACFAF